MLLTLDILSSMKCVRRPLSQLLAMLLGFPMRRQEKVVNRRKI